MEEKLSKKADTRIYNFVNAIQPGLSKNTTYDEAWQVLVDHCGIDGSLYTKDIRGKRRTTFKLFKNVTLGENDGDLVNEFDWANKDAWDSTHGDWNWTYVFKTIVDYIIDNKIVKKPRAKKSTIKKAAPVDKTMLNEVDDLKRKKSNLYQKIREWKKKGKDVSALQAEYNKLKSAI